MKLRRLSKEAFETLADRTRFRTRARAIAWEILVDGQAVADVAQRHEVTWKRAWFIINKLEKAYLQSDLLADAFVEVVLQLPEPISKELMQYSAVVAACTDQDRRNKSVHQVARGIKEETERLGSVISPVSRE